MLAFTLRTFIRKSLRHSLSLSLLTSAVSAYSQLNSGTQSVTLNAVMAETLTLSATSTSVNFALAGSSTATAALPVVIITTWVLQPSRANLVLDAYFASSSAALTDGAATPDYIPSSAVLGKVSTGTPTSYTAFTQTTALGPAGAGLTLFTVPLTASNRTGVRTDNLNLQINLSGLPQLPAGTYTGTITLQAQAL